MYKERKETTHGEIGEKKNIHHYIKNISTMYVNNVTRPMYKNNVSQIERKEKIHQVLTTSLNMHSPPNKNLLY